MPSFITGGGGASWEGKTGEKIRFFRGFVDYNFLDFYAIDLLEGRNFFFTLLAVFIVCLGLFGVAAYTTEQKTKEIGIRKVLGASVSGNILLFSKELIKRMFIANLIAWPLARFFLTDGCKTSPIKRISASGLLFSQQSLFLLLPCLQSASNPSKPPQPTRLIRCGMNNNIYASQYWKHNR